VLEELAADYDGRLQVAKLNVDENRQTPARFGILFLPGSLTDFGDLCREAEASGFDWLGVADSQSVFRELYVALTLAALNTGRMLLGPVVTNPLTRHLVVTASAMSSVDELSGGRAILGLGSATVPLYDRRPTGDTGRPRVIHRDLRRLTGGEPVEREGRTWRVSRRPAGCPSTSRLKGRGPRAGRTAGRRRDRRLWSDSDVIACRGRRSSAGPARPAGSWPRSTSGGSRRPACRSARRAIEPIKMALAASANHAFRFTLEGKGVPPDLHEKIKALQREYDAHQHEVPGAANAPLPDRWDLTDFLADRFAIAGTPDDCLAQISRAMAAGARQFMITGFVPDPRAFMRRWAREVVAALR
jgi:alkanesulfonate monooxygenase SsuD/methylene tetrahydromethanopterin reductase-like flavin-dependent oxidoreductase (luciferase family)